MSPFWKGKTELNFVRRSAFFFLALGLAVLTGCGQAPAPERRSGEEAQHTAVESAGRTAGRYDLERDEERGGHTLARHVARTDAQLAERLERERNISAASTWTDRDTAEEVVGEALRAERGRVENWMRRAFPRTNLALHYDAGRVIGRSLRRGESQAACCAPMGPTAFMF
jgi:hypothetical protein